MEADYALNPECTEILEGIVNRPSEHKGLIANMILKSGKDINDLGKYEQCKEDEKTRYIAFSVQGLPIGVYIGICGPVQCTEDDYNTARPSLAKLGNQILEYLDIDQAYFELTFTEDNFHFYDSEKQIEKVQTLSTGQYCSLAFVSILLLSVLIGTITEMIENRRKQLDPSYDPRSQRQTCMQKYFSAFRLIENSSKLLYARSKDGDKNLEILNGVRVLSMAWVILGHTYYYRGGAISTLDQN